MNTPTQINLLDFNLAGLEAFFEELGEPRYRASQVLKWIHFWGITDFTEMTNLSKALREKLAAKACVHLPEIAYEQISKDGTQKWLLRLHCGNCVEAVFIPEDDRGTLCVSSQVGCGLNCSFCATARQGFNRNLSTGEIIAQLWVAVRQLSKQSGQHDRHVTNVVMMGMGEPLLNVDPVIAAMDIMMDDNAYGLSKRRVTLSTSGLVPQMEILAQKSPVSLAVSLHAPYDELRNELVPINKKYPISALMDICKRYFADEPRRKVTFEYVMLDGVNDSVQHAKDLAKLLADVPAKLNLIPFNPFPSAPYRCSTEAAIHKFRDLLIKQGINTIVRRTRGGDIDAACGQLVGKVQDRTKRSELMRKTDLAKQKDFLVYAE